MYQIRVEQNNQISLPSEIVQQAGIQPNDVLDVTFIDGVVTLMPSRRVDSAISIMDYAGIGKGAWGKTADEIEANLARDRASWDR
ncbi:AbrB/MazE/SpoVT family DNA-binding domain-containing protein [Rugamonas sp.]|uniref:AbrB/MazE/SpoVT family DNA-binding domain-containing protein n=1 Tax=Rugamonas sp. TaxID=1926287 RepID=UPI0025E89473|nr:AbrB/MazE/SpoVT family DNA-binding domain-containing protein [Rugamonas sp.]